MRPSMRPLPHVVLMRRSRDAGQRAPDSGKTDAVQEIEFRVLGPLEVLVEGRALELKRRKQRSLGVATAAGSTSGDGSV